MKARWYSLTAKEGTYDDNDPIGVLDVTILTNQILSPDSRYPGSQDDRSGLILLEEYGDLENLKKRVDSGEMKVAFALYPVSM
ncbi:MAG: hypothetical protein MZV63_38075 [Marinilabiliales bacterium]|nr:hypothetical protein [Marinilabiliales bacterium]